MRSDVFTTGDRFVAARCTPLTGDGFAVSVFAGTVVVPCDGVEIAAGASALADGW